MHCQPNNSFEGDHPQAVLVATLRGFAAAAVPRAKPQAFGFHNSSWLMRRCSMNPTT